MSSKGVNKRAIENLIKAGAFDSLPGTRKQKMQVYNSIMDGVAFELKKNVEGQLSFFDMMEPENRPEEVVFPDCGDFLPEERLAFEKEVLGVYISGHPMQEYLPLLRKNSTCSSADFEPGPDGVPEVKDQALVVIGGMITQKQVKTTRNNAMMAILTFEDMVGTIEVLVFPKDFERLRLKLNPDAKMFIRGRVSVEEDKAAKLLLSDVVLFDEIPADVYIMFQNAEAFQNGKEHLEELLRQGEGTSRVVAYLSDEKKLYQMPQNLCITRDQAFLDRLREEYGADRVALKYHEVRFAKPGGFGERRY